VARVNPIKRYTLWLHGQWPAGQVEKLPLVREDGSTNVPGVYIAGDLTGIPLLKFAVDRGARVIQTIVADSSFAHDEQTLDLIIIGAGVAGMSAALEARQSGLSFELLEATEPFSTIVNFPKGKPIFTYPTGMQTAGQLRVSAKVKEGLVAELEEQTLGQGIRPRMVRAERIVRSAGLLQVELAEGEPLTAKRVLVATGRSGNFRKLAVPGEELHDKVFNRLHDPKEFAGKQVLVVGGGDSALETAIALAGCGASVTISYRKQAFSRPKPENLADLLKIQADPLADVGIERPVSERVTTSTGVWYKRHKKAGSVTLLLGSQLQRIEVGQVLLTDAAGETQKLPNDYVFSMIGREPPFDFFRRSGIAILGEWRLRSWLGLIGFIAFCVALYHWKSSGLFLHEAFKSRGWFPFAIEGADPKTLIGALFNSFKDPSFYYSSLYCACIVIFGIRRIRRRQTPYVTRQTLCLMSIQLVPLFLLPYILLPWMGANGVFDSGLGKLVGDQLFPGKSYWRSFGLILAWPLFIWNVFTSQPIWAWLAISLIQTFVIIPLLIYRYGKGAYCGWICSCGALAETMGDAHREKMPHGPFWNRLNMVGQLILLCVFALLALRCYSWIFPGGGVAQLYERLLRGGTFSYKYIVDLWLAGVVGVAFYFHLSGRVWCRFACPLAALMNIYARFTSFRILADKSKCISCNVCTRVCHQGIDIMNFANKGEPMADPQCVRCSACVQSCPTGVLAFGRIDLATGEEISRDRLRASAVQMTEGS